MWERIKKYETYLVLIRETNLVVSDGNMSSAIVLNFFILFWFWVCFWKCSNIDSIVYMRRAFQLFNFNSFRDRSINWNRIKNYLCVWCARNLLTIVLTFIITTMNQPHLFRTKTFYLWICVFFIFSFCFVVFLLVLYVFERFFCWLNSLVDWVHQGLPELKEMTNWSFG